MTFAPFRNDLVEPYILEDITRQMQDAQSHLLNLAEEHQHAFETENNLLMNAAPARPLAIEPPPLYAAEVAACMITEKYQPWLNEVGRQFIAQQAQLGEMQRQVAEAHERRTPVEVAFSEVVRSRGTTPSVKNLRPSSCPLGVTKSSSISSGTSSRQHSPQPPPPEAVPAIPSPLPQ